MANLTTKELQALSDQLSAEQLAIAKNKMYAEASCDAQLKENFNSIAAKHQTHYDKLMGLLN